MPDDHRPIDWAAFAAGTGPTPSRSEADILWAERLAIERERLAVEAAVRRAIETGEGEVRPYQPAKSFLRLPYLASLFTVVLLLLLSSLGLM